MKLLTVLVALLLLAADDGAGVPGTESPWGDEAWEEAESRDASADRSDAPREPIRDPDAAFEPPAEADEPAAQNDAPSDPYVEEWRASLLYGIDDLVLEALDAMIAAEQPGLGRETVDLLSETRNNEVRAKAFEYLRATRHAGGFEKALSLLQEGLDGEVTRAGIRYLRDLEPDDSHLTERRTEALFALIPDSSPRTAQLAVRAIGNVGGADEARRLAELFTELPEISQQLQGEILLALGDIGAEGAVPFLMQILEDPVFGSVLRRYAADGLGRTGDERALPALRGAAQSEDSALKAYAVGALARFEDPESVDTLRRAMRDSNPLVRRFAIEGLGRNHVEDAVPALIFQVRRDPDMQVRSTAVAALAEIGNDEAIAFLHEQYRASGLPVELRNRIAGALIEHLLDRSDQVLRGVMEDEWTARDSRVLDHLARTLSETEDERLGSYYRRLLEHPNFVIQIYAVRGIGLNRLPGFEEALERRAEEHNHPALKRSAEAALEQLDG